MCKACNSCEGVLRRKGDSYGIRRSNGDCIVVGFGKIVIFSPIVFDLVGGDSIDGGGIGCNDDFLKIERRSDEYEEGYKDAMHESFHVFKVCIVTLY